MHVGEVRREQMGAFFSILSADGRRVGASPSATTAQSPPLLGGKPGRGSLPRSLKDQSKVLIINNPPDFGLAAGGAVGHGEGSPGAPARPRDAPRSALKMLRNAPICSRRTSPMS